MIEEILLGPYLWVVILLLVPIFLRVKYVPNVNKFAVFEWKVTACRVVALSLGFICSDLISYYFGYTYEGIVVFLILSLLHRFGRQTFSDYLEVLTEVSDSCPQIHFEFPASPGTLQQPDDTPQDERLDQSQRRIEELDRSPCDVRESSREKDETIRQLKKRLREPYGQDWCTQRIHELERDIRAKDQELQVLNNKVERGRAALSDYNKLDVKYKNALKDAEVPEKVLAELDDLKVKNADIKNEAFQAQQTVTIFNRLISILLAFTSLAHNHEARIAVVIIFYGLWQNGIFPDELGVDAARLEEMYQSIQLGPSSPFRHNGGLQVPVGRLCRKNPPKTPWSDQPQIELLPFMDPSKLQQLQQPSLQNMPQPQGQSTDVVLMNKRVDSPLQQPTPGPTSNIFNVPATGGINSGATRPNPFIQPAQDGAKPTQTNTLPQMKSSSQNPFMQGANEVGNNQPRSTFAQSFAGKPSSEVFGAPSGSIQPAVPNAMTSSFGKPSGPAVGTGLTTSWGKPSGPAVPQDDPMDTDMDSKPAGFGTPTPSVFRAPSATFGQPSSAATGFGQSAPASSGFGKPASAATGFSQSGPAATGFGKPSPAASGFGQTAPASNNPGIKFQMTPTITKKPGTFTVSSQGAAAPPPGKTSGSTAGSAPAAPADQSAITDDMLNAIADVSSDEDEL